MSDLQSVKSTVRNYMQDFDASEPDQRLKTLQRHVSETYFWRGMHPFHEQPDAQCAVQSFWTPFLTAFTSIQRREDVFLAGLNDCDQQTTVWTCSMGHFLGLFDQPWLGIPPTRKMAFLRYAEFHRVENGKIAETALFCDILSVIHQAGLSPLPPQTGGQFIQPGPRTHDGIMLKAHNASDGIQTLNLVNRMASDISKANKLMKSDEGVGDFTPHAELSRNWHEDMIWYGPAGIGSTYTIERYIEQHQKPFRRQLSDRVFHGHVARIAEGNYCGFFGWPNLSLTPTGDYLGLPATNVPAPMRVVDVYRRDGDKLAENWVFIDLLHFLNVQGLDVLGQLQST